MKELADMVQRVEAAKMLLSGNTYEQIDQLYFSLFRLDGVLHHFFSHNFLILNSAKSEISLTTALYSFALHRPASTPSLS